MNMNMNNMTDRELFKLALIEARERKIQAVLDRCPEEIVPPPELIAFREKLLKKHSPQYKRRKRLLIGLVAALLVLLVSCAAYVNKNRIADFMEELLGDHAKVVAADQSGDATISIPEEDRCTLGYVPEGYELYLETMDPGITMIWKNSNKKIKFDQKPLNTSYSYDTEQGYSFSMEINDLEIYHRTLETSNIYIWTDETYVYELTVPDTLSEAEVIKIIQNIQPQS